MFGHQVQRYHGDEMRSFTKTAGKRDNLLQTDAPV